MSGAPPASVPCCGELVGGTGRIGSALLRYANSEGTAAGGLAAVGREGEIGAASPPSTPIYVCCGADALEDVVQRTRPDRLCDLVLMQNGMLRERLARTAARGTRGVTIAVLYFSVLEVGGPAKNGSTTHVHGKWAERFRDLLARNGLACEVAASEAALDARAAEKLMWASCMWVVCHTDVGRPRTVWEVHEDETLGGRVRELVAELLPIAQERLGVLPSGGGGGGMLGEGGVAALLDSVEGVYGRMREYSRGIPAAVPSRKMALEEMASRNGWFLLPQPAAGEDPRQRQRVHLELLERQGVVYDVSCGLRGVA